MTLDDLRRAPLPELPDAITRYLLQLPIGEVFELLETVETRLAAREAKTPRPRRPAPAPSSSDASSVMPSALRGEAAAEGAE